MKKDTSKMTKAELKKYKKTLATVRQYTRDRRAWQKAVKAGSTEFKTLREYRAAKHGNFPAAQSERVVKNAQVPITGSDALMESVSKLQRLLNEVQQTKVQIAKMIQVG